MAVLSGENARSTVGFASECSIRYTLILSYCNAFSSSLWLRESFFFFLKHRTENTHNSLGSGLYWQQAQSEGTVFDIAADQRGRRLVEMERLSSMDKTVL